MRFLGRRTQGLQSASWEGLAAPALETRCSGEFPRCSARSGDFPQRLELAMILAGEAAVEAARLAKSAVFAAVASKSGRLDQPVGRSRRVANGLVNQPTGPLV